MSNYRNEILRKMDENEILQALREAEEANAEKERINRLLVSQMGVSRAFGKMYFAIYDVDLEDGYYREISTRDVFRESLPERERNSYLFDVVVRCYVAEKYQEEMREFLNLDTLQERLADTNFVSHDFCGTTQGWCRASLVAETRDAAGKVIRLVYVTQEINQEKQKELERIEALNKAYEAANAANRAKSDFLFKMSHDIRTPLNAIMGFGSLIGQNAENPQKVREYASKIAVSGNLLLSLLNEMLDMTKIESGEAVLSLAPFSLEDLIEELNTVIRTQTDAGNLSFDICRKNLRYLNLVGDMGCIRRVLFNILSNAVKYTPAGGSIVFTIVEAESGEPGRIEVVFSVKDTGIGISKEYKEKVFDAFTRARDDSAVMQIPGTGLGLSIAKGFTEFMGGSISVESEPGHGSEFVVRLPMAVCSLKEVSPQKNSEEAGDEPDVLKGLRILVVEDNAVNMEIVTEILSLAGAVCDAAVSGAEAIRKVSAAACGFYDLILMDIRMPEMDGYETTRRIRALDRPDVKELPIIALTANAFAEDVQNALDAGMNAHLAKPLNMEQLRRTVKEVLHCG